MSTAGAEAEQAAAEYLTRQGFTVIERNFRTPACEIDIVAQKEATMYFIEVKYRRSEAQGSGLAYITPQKLRHMERAAQVWLQKHRWDGDITLSAIELTGPYEVTNFIESIE